MAFKAVLLFCAQALLIQSVVSQIPGANFGGFSNNGGGITGSIGGGAISGLGGLGCGCGGAPSSGGGFPISSASHIAPYGISVVSENQYEGQLSVGGNLPLLGTVALEGVVPTNGNGAVSYGCGDSSVGITSESIPANQYGTGNQYGPGNQYSPGNQFGPGNQYSSGNQYNPGGFGGIGYGAIGYGSGLNGCGCSALY